MDRLIKRTLGLATFLSALLLAGVSAAEEPLKTPSLDTEGKPLNPPAPTKAGTPKLGGLSRFGGVMLVDMGPVNDRLQEQRALSPSDLPIVFPLLGGQGFGLWGGWLRRSPAEPCSQSVSEQQWFFDGRVRARPDGSARQGRAGPRGAHWLHPRVALGRPVRLPHSRLDLQRRNGQWRPALWPARWLPGAIAGRRKLVSLNSFSAGMLAAPGARSAAGTVLSSTQYEFEPSYVRGAGSLPNDTVFGYC